MTPSSLTLTWFLASILLSLALARAPSEDFQCYKCEEDTEKPLPGKCSEIQTCSGGRPICAKLQFSAFFHGVMGTKTLKFCYDLSREESNRPLEEIDLCDVAHHDFHSFSLETRSILGTVCKNKHSTWHMSHSCTTSLCNGAISLIATHHIAFLSLFVVIANALIWFMFVNTE